MPEIRPIKDLRNTTEISELCHSIQEPVFITKNGYGDLVIMSMDTYEQQLNRIGVHQKLLEAEIEIQNGEPLQCAENVFSKLRNKHAL
ncbi:type II toxin-antitoxin system Phd/YefM family antitoxin [Sporosarcina saromensis]|uniref:Type II toxin-antitoxin system Phd/YefM family antitoxin n=1 Tax=Sporosarcina saromensis TaxID=359365 RepID=A0ABU4G885_9BACL|nr:type II toxin-antitoxin system Phd/YefM family antitoxin [Sporosarcina saromensis]MDW0113191.1 type II toxin-antitoxin system Phd/YefM family antitoxin [Sporosarcina saromensis]